MPEGGNPVLFRPDYYISHYSNLDLDRLKRRGIKLLLCDIDNTLVAWNDPDNNVRVKRFISKVKRAGLKVALVSNAMPKRASRFARDLGVEKVFCLSCKPLPRNLKKAMRFYHVKPEETALLGDQLMTDVLGANLAGVYSILTHPITESDKFDTQINRFFENRILDHYEKKGVFKRREFDD
jgi:hypothetical protein|uniref:HAD phosphatase, family IIIA n=1 Tax=Faecalibaculum rodentium TaxID=1702221 RepID=A0A140DY83_9FIRM|nr:HAD phosphatase, family IIIA [Faecalibaculum rodentium]